MEGEEMKKSVMIGLALVFAFVAVFIIMESEDSDAAIKKEAGDAGNAYVKGLKYDLCAETSDNPETWQYGSKYVAFLTGGNSDLYNASYRGPVAEIVPTISASGHTYTVVGIRNNAFQASLTKHLEGGGCGAHLEKVIIPETVQYIGVNGSYNPEMNWTSCFSGCEKLKEIVFDGENPQLKQIGGNSFNGAAIELLDLSHCTQLNNIMAKAFNDCDSLREIDIRNIKFIGENAFFGLDTQLEEIIMPMDVGAIIDNKAFPDLKFYDEDGTEITTGAGLIGKSFKVDGGVMKQGHVALFNSNGGNEHLHEDVFLVGDELPTVTHEKYIFYKWKDNISGNYYLTMPALDTDKAYLDLIAVWEIEKPTSVTLTYNGYEQTAYHDTHAYTVSGSSHKNVGSYETTFTLKENFMWADETSDPAVVSWTIAKKLLTATYHGENVKPDATPLLKVDVTGFVGGETPQTAAGYVSPFISDKDLPTDMGKYTLTPIGGAADNYEFEYKSGTLHNNFGLEESEYVFVGTVALVVLMSLYMLFTHTLAGRKH